MTINQKNSEGHSREHKLLGVSKGLCSAFLWHVVIGKVNAKHREDLQFYLPGRGLA